MEATAFHYHGLDLTAVVLARKHRGRHLVTVQFKLTVCVRFALNTHLRAAPPARYHL